MGWWTKAKNKVGNAAKTVGNVVMAPSKALGNALQSTGIPGVAHLGKGFNNSIDGVGNVVKHSGNIVGDLVTGNFGGVWDNITKLPGDVWDSSYGAIRPFINGLGSDNEDTPTQQSNLWDMDLSAPPPNTGGTKQQPVGMNLMDRARNTRQQSSQLAEGWGTPKPPKPPGGILSGLSGVRGLT